ncbi:MAG: hypothetical protein CMJ38_02135 [Phycisphaerae bacterium]|nr:hypothetical protein [Phycisphaerae bacterium]|tara:strand:- start:450 stop:1199 length:750 start_codon:yes stop_codon:yes gene_type:complete
MIKWHLCVLSVALLFSCKIEDTPVAHPVSIQIPDTTHVIELVPVSTESGTVFWMAKTELTWDVYDTFLQIVNSPENLYAEVDAITGPTPAYASVDRGFGRSGYPAISMSAQAADAFCIWLTKATGTNFTIPTLEQYEAANAGGGTSWHQFNSEKTTHPVGTKEPNSLGIYDIEGNVGEWVMTEDGHRVVGGSFRDSDEVLGSKTMLTPIPEWNKTDPQLPRSPWWLADADFVGLRLVINDHPSEKSSNK